MSKNRRLLIELSNEVVEKVENLGEQLGIKSKGLIIDLLLRELLIEGESTEAG